MSGLDFHLFGAPRIARDGAAVTVERRKSLALLAYLAVTRQPHGRDALATLLWPERDASHGRGQLRTALADLQRAIGPGWLETEGDQVALADGPGLRVDVGRFHDLLAEVAAHSHPPHRQCDACLADLTAAADLYTADFLAGFTLADAGEFDAWQTFQTESLRLELAGALEKLATGLAGRQDYAPALTQARRGLALDPLHEPAHRLLMQLHAWAGERAAALRQYGECVKVLQAELGIAPEPETTALYEAIRSGTTGEAAPGLPRVPASAPAHNLPADVTPFIGRAAELAQITARLADPACRLLTILGPGGMGKTRLAIQAARGRADSFAHGVCFVDLAPVTAAEQLGETILRALHAPGAGAPDQRVLTHLADKQMLLVLDNYEQLLREQGSGDRGQGSGDRGQEAGDRGQGSGDGAELLTTILRGAPKVKLLVTSRTRLNVRAEWLAPLDGLATPGEDDSDRRHVQRSILSGTQRSGVKSKDAERPLDQPASFDSGLPTPQTSAQDARGQGWEHYDATALFLACVRRVQPDFRPTADDAGHIARICGLLDGIPLAIELAAARQRALSLGEIARELEQGLSLLATKARDVPERQRSMTATFDYSWGLLSPHEQSILRQLSVFRGGFTRVAAGGVAGATLSDLDNLVDASWISLRTTGRYELHELIHQYCAERLASEHGDSSGESVNTAYGRHAVYFRSLLLDRQRDFYRQPGIVSEMATEYDNLLAAWTWFIAADDLDAVRTMIRGLQWITLRQGWVGDFKPRLASYAQKLMSLMTDEPSGWVSERALTLATALAVLFDVSDAYRWRGETRSAWGREIESLLAQAETGDTRWREVDWLLRYQLALWRVAWGEYAETARLLRALLFELDEGRFEPWPYAHDACCYWQIEGRSWLTRCLLNLGQYEEAQHVAEQSLALAEQSGEPILRTEGLKDIAFVALHTGDCQRAEQYARDGLAICQAHGNRRAAAQATWFIGVALAGQGKYTQARAFLRRTLAFARETGDQVELIVTLGHLGSLALAIGNVLEAEGYLREMSRLCENWELSFGQRSALTGLGRVALARGDPVEARSFLLRALKISSRVFPITHTIGAIAAVAELRQAEGQLEAAAELCAALLSWPATPNYAPETTQHLRTELAERLRQLEAQLSPEVFAAAVACGRSRQIEDVVAQLIGGAS